MTPFEFITVPQSKLSSECFAIQFQGLKACEHCEYKGKKDCGGKKIRKTLMNEKGFQVPLR
jgi:hypothetical protein